MFIIQACQGCPRHRAAEGAAPSHRLRLLAWHGRGFCRDKLLIIIYLTFPHCRCWSVWEILTDRKGLSNSNLTLMHDSPPQHRSYHADFYDHCTLILDILPDTFYEPRRQKKSCRNKLILSFCYVNLLNIFLCSSIFH